MNPNVGRLYVPSGGDGTGYPVLDGTQWDAQIRQGLWNKCQLMTVPGPDPNNPQAWDSTVLPQSYITPVSDTQFQGIDGRANSYVQFYALKTPELADLQARRYSFDMGSGISSWSQPWTAADMLRIQQSTVAALANPNQLYVMDCAQLGIDDPSKGRVKILYYRVADVVMPVAAMKYYQPSSFVSEIRPGLIWFVMCVFSAIGAPVLSSAGSAIVSGTDLATVGATQASIITTAANTAAMISGNSNVALVGKVANLAAGGVDSGVGIDSASNGFSQAADSQAANIVSNGATVFDDITPDTALWTDGWNFSSGESFPAFSDAQNVDFGLGTLDGTDWADPNATTGFGLNPTDIDTANNDFDWNATPEVTTNDFGTTFDGPSPDGSGGGSDWGNEGSHALIGAAPIAASAAASANNANPAGGTPASSGSSGAKAAAGNSGGIGAGTDILSSIGKVFTVATGVAGGALGQAQTQQQKTYSGQLTGSGGSTVNVGGMSLNTVAVIGAGLLAVALLLHMKG